MVKNVSAMAMRQNLGDEFERLSNELGKTYQDVTSEEALSEITEALKAAQK